MIPSADVGYLLGCERIGSSLSYQVSSPASSPIFELTLLAALVVYEFLITFEQELAVVWRRKLTLASVLLIAIRWTILLEAIFLILPQPSETVRQSF